MIDKCVASMTDALAGISDGAVVMVGGFGAVGQPNELLEGLLERGTRDLVIVSNNAGSANFGLGLLIQLGRVRRLISSYPRATGSRVFEERYAAGEIELELVPQGTLAERIRAAGAGIPAFYTPTGFGTQLAEGKPTATLDGRPCVLERALHADVALVEAWEGDRWGNLSYRGSGRNFNPIMATAAKLTVAQVQRVVALGAIAPDHVVTPGVYVDRLVEVPNGGPRQEKPPT